jgi:hypothetical protein
MKTSLTSERFAKFVVLMPDSQNFYDRPKSGVRKLEIDA